MPLEFSDERRYLEIIRGKLQKALKELDAMIAGYKEDYRKSMKYLWRNRSGMDSMEIFSNEKSVSQIVNSGEMTVKRRSILEKLLDSPYFARIDFRHNDEEEAEQVYIGRFSFVEEDCNMLIYDWRAPVSGMYYDFELGPAFYQAPGGLIEGVLTRKRQFKIKKGSMEYALESSISINDEVLQRELSHTSDQRMKNIVATIQKEQNRIIRNEAAEVLVIQGAAGSGKTSIALHRVAYFLYKYKDQLSARDIMIISPNKVFADYISNVLPELGEEPVLEAGFEDIAEELLERSVEYERYTEQIERILEENDGTLAERISFKSSAALLPLLDAYLEQLKKNKDLRLRYDSMPALYKGFYEYVRRPDMLVLNKDNRLEASDLYPYIYLKINYEGMEGFRGIRHVVIDEMQDYTPIQYAVLSKLYRCRKTILGDFGQSVNPYNSISRETLKEIYEEAEYVELRKSYRSTCEIIRFAQKIQSHGVEPIERHGREPEIIRCEDWVSELSVIDGILADFKKDGYCSLGIICRTNRQAEQLYRELSIKHQINQLDSDSSKFTDGVTIASVHMSKGLEFDQVVVPGADSGRYRSEYDRSLLYIACTRAMHRLTVTCHGELTEILEGNCPRHLPANPY